MRRILCCLTVILCLALPTQAAMNAKVGVFTKNAGSVPYPQSLTGLGFTPKAIIFWTSSTADGFEAVGQFALGITTGASNS